MTDEGLNQETTVTKAQDRLSPAFAEQYERALTLDLSASEVLDEERAALVIAAREKLTQQAVIEWAEVCGVGTQSTVTRRKLRL